MATNLSGSYSDNEVTVIANTPTHKTVKSRTLTCYRCGGTYAGVHERDRMCPYCLADRIRAVNEREKIEDNKSKCGFNIPNFISSISSLFGMIIMWFGI